MPNHVVNEIIFHNVGLSTQMRLVDALCDERSNIDFEKIVPLPLNIWWGSVGSKHSVFPDNALNWCAKNWGTKWNAYRHKPTETTSDSITFVFETAWSTPYGWLVAVFNKFKLPFEYNTFSEGEERARSGKFWIVGDGVEWDESPAKEETHRRMHLLQWGVEQFDEEPA